MEEKVLEKEKIKEEIEKIEKDLKKNVENIKDLKELNKSIDSVKDLLELIDIYPTAKRKLLRKLKKIRNMLINMKIKLIFRKREILKNDKVAIYYDFYNIKSKEDIEKFIEYLASFLVKYTENNFFDTKKLIRDVFRTDIKESDIKDKEISFEFVISKKDDATGLTIKVIAIRNNDIIEIKHVVFDKTKDELTKEEYEMYKKTIKIAKKIVYNNIKDFKKIQKLDKLLEKLNKIIYS